MDARSAIAAAEAMFKDRVEYESLWETAYKFIAPERSLVFSKSKRTPSQIQDEVFDSTAIDAAERLNNLLVSGMTPPWQKWLRLIPGTTVSDDAERELLRPALMQLEDLMFSLLTRSNFYQEIQPSVLDRIVGGTHALMMTKDIPARRLRFKAIPLGQLALREDDSGEIVTVARRYKLSIRQMIQRYGMRVPQELQNVDPIKQNLVDQELFAINDITAAGLWRYVVVHKGKQLILEDETDLHPTIFASRWSKVPGSVYGRGPGLRALSDIRALNKVKELQLKNAAKAVAGVYTVVDDGVINPYTLTFEPGTFLPVGSNDRQNPSIQELPASGDFNVSLFTIQDLRQSIEKTFMADNFGPIDQTPKTATEVAQRSNIIAQDMGSTIARLQFEMLLPIVRAVYGAMAEMEMVPEELQLDGETLDVEFVSQLAQAQWALDEQNLLEFTQIATQFGEIDPKAGMIIDVHKALRRLAEIKHIPPQAIRTEQEIAEIMQQAAEVQVAQEQQMAGGVEGGMV